MSTQHNHIDPTSLDDQALIASLRRVRSVEHRCIAALVEHLAELDVRGLYRDAGCSSLHVYCTDSLQMSDAEAYARIHAARLSRRFPALLAHLRQGTLTLTTLQILGPKLDDSSCSELLDCTFVSKDGKRCEERGWLQLDHEKPYATGGEHNEGNVRMICWAHNQLLAERAFGPLFMQQRRTLSGECSQS